MKPNSLLKVVSILYIIVAAIGLLLAILVAVMGGAVFGSLAESAGFGLAVVGIMGVVLATGSAMSLAAGIVGVVLAAGSAMSLAAGIVGVKGKFTACKVLGIIMLVGTVITVLLNISAYDSVGAIIATAVAYLVLPVLYVIGAFKGPAAD